MTLPIPMEAPAPDAEAPLPMAPMAMQIIEGIDALRESVEAPFSIEKDTRMPVDQGPQDDVVADDGTTGLPSEEQQEDPVARSAMAALYGHDFPLLGVEPKLDDWADWAKIAWDRHSAGISTRLHLVERNRLFRQGIQWVSSVGLGAWREPPKPRDAARVVDNMVAPALDQRVQVVSEQRPGFRVRPENGDPVKLKKAEAKQNALEYQWDQQQMQRNLRELAYWAGTDGVSFGHIFWNPERGPWEDAYGEGKPAPLGDLEHEVLRMEQVRVSADATANRPPMYVITRKTIPVAQAVATWGQDVVADITPELGYDTTNSGAAMPRLGYNQPRFDELLREQDTLDVFRIYCQKSEFLPQGLELIVAGRKVITVGPLTFGVIPIYRYTDGNTDPSYFPQAVMEGWLDAQMRVNAVKSKWVESVRLNSGAKLLAKQHAIVGETLVGGTMTIIEAKGLGGLAEIVRPLDGYSIAPDAKELLALEKKCFEDLSGWNDVSRGQFASDQSGRAILAIREQLERIFAPGINAASDAMVDWAKIACAGMKFGYDIPRYIGIQGQSRPDLAMVVQAEDMDGISDVFVDPETLMPMPRSLKLMLLDQYFDKGMMDAQEYRRRSPFAWTKNISTPDEDQEARAKRCAEALRQGQALPILWVDNEAIHQDVLERELILPDDTDPMIRQAALQRWMQLAQQAQMKMGGMPPAQDGGPAPSGSGGQDTPQPSASEQPFQGTNPGIAATGGQTDQNQAARQFDKSQPY